MGHLLRRQAEENGGLDAIVVLAEGVEARLSYGELFERAARLAGWLGGEAGLARGDRVAMLLDNSSAREFFITQAAAFVGGFVSVPINARLAPPEIEYQLRHCGARALVSTGEFETQVARALPAVGAAGRAPLILDAGENPISPPPGCTRVSLAAAIAAGEPADPDCRREDLCDLLYTSGTTGRPKGALFDHGACLEQGRIWSQTVGFGRGDSVMLASPVYTSTGSHSFPLPAFHSAMTVIFEERFDTGLWVERLRRERPTYYLGVSAMYALILNALSEEELAAVEAPPNLIYGGAPMPLPLAERLGKTFPDSRLWTIYGLTESGPTGTTLQPEDGLRRLGSVGRAQIDVEVEVRDEQRQRVASGESGEITIKTPARMRGYFEDEEATARAIDEAGWLGSGDVGWIDEEGFVFLLDRKNDVIIRGGFNVYPAEIESALSGHPAVLEAAVVGVPHDVLGEDVKAFVVLADGGEVSDAELKEHCVDVIADFKRPRIVEFVDSLPRNAMGKVLRRELRGRS